MIFIRHESNATGKIREKVATVLCVPVQTVPNHTPDQLSQLRHLLAAPDSRLPDKARLRVKALIALCEGKKLSEIINETRLTSEGLRKIRKRVEATGIGAEIDKATKTSKIGGENSGSRPKRGRGRPATPNLAAWANAQHPKREPLVDLVMLTLSPTVKWAVIGLRPGDAKNDNTKKRNASTLQKAVDEAWAHREVPRWTIHLRDTKMMLLFTGFREEIAQMKNSKSDREPDPRLSESVLTSYSAPWSFIILHAANIPPLAAASSPLTPRISKVIGVRHDAFLNELESLLYSLRNRENLLGLCCGFESFQDYRTEEMYQEPPPPIAWSINEKPIQDAVAWRQLESCLYGLAGVAFELTAKVRSSISKSERFTIGPIELRPRITVKPEEDGKTALVEYALLPEVKYRFRTKMRGTVQQVESGLRKILRERGQRAVLEYSVRVAEDQTRTAYPTELASYDWRESATQRVAVVSVPRQWLMERPYLPLSQIVKMARAASEVSSRPKLAGVKQERLLLFHAPLLLEAIRQAFQANRYGDWVEELLLGDHRLGNVPPSGVQRMTGYLGPPYYFTPEELVGPIHDVCTMGRLAECAMAYAEVLKTADRHNIPVDRRPTYDAERVFKSLLTDYDADFLLREIDDPTWQKLRSLTKGWGELWMKVISESYWAESRIDDGLVFLAIRRSLRPAAGKMREQVHGWTSDALPLFVGGACRILRHAIETMQRFVAADLPLVCAAVRTEKSLLRSWKSYLGRYLNGRILDELERHGDMRIADENQTGETEDDEDNETSGW